MLAAQSFVFIGGFMKKAPEAGKIAPRKRMAMGDFGETFGVESHESAHGGKPVTSGGKRGSGADYSKGMKAPK